MNEIEKLKTYSVEVEKDDVEKCVSLADLRALLDRSPSVSAPTIPEGYLTKVVEMCAKIAEKYEPEEKQSYIDYASKEIRRTLPAMLCANQGSDKDES